MTAPAAGKPACHFEGYISRCRFGTPHPPPPPPLFFRRGAHKIHLTRDIADFQKKQPTPCVLKCISMRYDAEYRGKILCDVCILRPRLDIRYVCGSEFRPPSNTVLWWNSFKCHFHSLISGIKSQ